MRKKNKVNIIVKNVFRTNDTADTKKKFNKVYDNYINFCENRN